MACSCCVLYKASTEKPIDRMLSSLVSDYLNDNCKSVADEFNEKVKPPLLTRKSPNLRDILKFFLQRSEQSVSLVYRLKECEEQDSEEPEKNWAVYHAMCYEPIAPRKSSETNTWAKAQPKNDPTVKKEEIIAQIGRPSPELIRKTTPMLVRKDIAQKSKLSSKKSALIKNMIKKREQISVVKKKVPKREKKRKIIKSMD